MVMNWRLPALPASGFVQDEAASRSSGGTGRGMDCFSAGVGVARIAGNDRREPGIGKTHVTRAVLGVLRTSVRPPLTPSRHGRASLPEALRMAGELAEARSFGPIGWHQGRRV